MKLLQKKNPGLISDICVGPVPHNQTGVMLSMSADPVAMMTGLVVKCKLNRHAHWPVAT